MQHSQSITFSDYIRLLSVLCVYGRILKNVDILVFVNGASSVVGRVVSLKDISIYASRV